MARDVKFNIKLIIDGKEHVVSASTSVKELSKNIAKVREESKGTLGKMMEWNNASLAFNNINYSLQSLVSATKNYSAANAVQVEAETKLATVMRQRMGATDAEIQSVKELASAQQQLGVIGDEIQLMGAQQLATFLTQKDSIDALIPAMNNLIAQQRGINATGQDAVSVCNLMGKAMQGQVSALKRVGITFTDAQAEVMKYGTETERAAMLSQIITDNVGNMNAELAKTDAGKAKQAANDLGDLKE